VVAFGERMKKGVLNHSFHVNFPYHGFEDPFQLKAWLAEHVGELMLDYDANVYGRHQLMRLPWCGKQGDVDAVLLPTQFLKDGDSGWLKSSMDAFDGAQFDKFNINFYDWERKGVMVHEHDVATKTRGVRVSDTRCMPQAVTETCPEDRYSVDMMRFFVPLMSFIREKIQQHRREIAKLLCVGGVPTHAACSPLVLQTCKGHDNLIGIFHYKVDGDMFCEYDHPVHMHTSGASKVTIQINFLKGTYNQMCHVCRPAGDQIRYYSLFALDDIVVRLYTKNVSHELLTLSKDGIQNVFVKYFHHDLIYNPNLSDSIIVYDAETKLWVYSERTKQNLLTKKKNDMKEKYINYITARYSATVATRRRLTDKKGKSKIEKEGKELSRVPAFVDIKNFADVIAQNINQVGIVVESMDPYPNLVALSDGQCYDVFTGLLQPIEKTHYFTSCLNGTVKPFDKEDEDIKFILDWFLEISAQRPDLSTYLQRLNGLFYTFLKLDRKFYGNVAPSGNNGKSILRKMLKATMTDPTNHGQHRYTNLNNKFFSARANSNVNAGAPRPEWVNMLHKTAFLVEELPGEKLDVEILKIIASMDDYEARRLYANNIINVAIRGRLMINTNYAPQLGDTKPVWNRAVFIPWLCVYVEKQEQVDHANHRYLMDEQFINKITARKDAFITVCLHALHMYIKPHMVDGKMCVSEIIRPDCVIEFTEQHRQKHMSVEIFMTRYMKAKFAGDIPTPCTKAHVAYRQFLRDQGSADVDYITFFDKLEVHGFETHVEHDMDFFNDYVLTNDGFDLCNNQAPRGSIEHGFFNQQNKRARLSHNEDE
jgi:phage/plasmid-associated DNA primase